MLKCDEDVRRLARDHRREPTPTEKIVWRWLRSRRCADVKFRRQFPVGRYVLDFYCDKVKLAIEVDGGYHTDPDQRDRDALRTEALAKLGITILRIANEDVRREPRTTFERIVAAVQAAREARPSPGATRHPLPAGEGADARTSEPSPGGRRWPKAG